MPPSPPTVHLPEVLPLVVLRFQSLGAPPWAWSKVMRNPNAWARRNFAGDCIAAFEQDQAMGISILHESDRPGWGVEVSTRAGVKVPLIPSSFFADWRPLMPLLCPPFRDGRLIFTGEPAVCDLVDLADADNFATTYLD